MIKNIQLDKKVDKTSYKKQRDELEEKLGQLQRSCKEKKIPVIILFEGFGTSGKGMLINELMQTFDPRGTKVITTKAENEEERMYPHMRRFWCNTPAMGEIAIFDRGWYRKALLERFDGDYPDSELPKVYSDINVFERQLTDEGTVIIKLFLAISQEEQKKRLKKLMNNSDSAWRVSKDDVKRNKKYNTYLEINDQMLENTNTSSSYWNIIEADNKEYAILKMMKIVATNLESALSKDTLVNQAVVRTPVTNSVLNGIDLNKSMSKEEYKEEIKKLQSKLIVLQNQLFRTRIPLVVAFEGWDAGGKGGAIKRLTAGMDPRGYMVNPIASPTDVEKSHHYLWRFWTRLQKNGHVTIFDRTWYGRVMVERVEGFCSKASWNRAYQEINEFEKQLADDGTIIVKFWLHIDKDEQERRFKERMDNPLKQWKITDEDWRNRDKWDDYLAAVDDMLVKTSTTYSPWTIVEGNDKYYARVKVLKTVIHAIEERIGKFDA